MPQVLPRVAFALLLSMGGGGGATLLAQVVLRATIGTLGTNEWFVNNIWPWIGVPVGLGLGIGFLMCFAEPAPEQVPDLPQADESDQKQAAHPLVPPDHASLLTASAYAALTRRQQHVVLAIIAGMQAASGAREDTRQAREQELVDSGRLPFPPPRHFGDGSSCARGCGHASRGGSG